MLKTLFFSLSILFSLQSFGQEYFEEFKEHMKTGDTLKQIELLEEWSLKSPNNAELFTSYFNYYFSKSQTELLTINSERPTDEEDVLFLKDSSDQIAGFIGTIIDYDQSNLKKAFTSIDQGIEAYPNRLDMRFGKIYALGKIKHWERFTNELIEAINYSVENDNAWTWTYNEKKSEGKEMFLSSIQNYIRQLYNTNDDALMQNIQDISKAVLAHYPNHVESLSNLSVSYLIKGDYQNALAPLLKAEEIDPKDFIVLNNIAFAYKETGNKEKAVEYYEKVLEFGDDQAKTQAKAMLKELNP